MEKNLFNNGTKFTWRNMPLLYLYIFQFIAEKAGKFDQEISSKLIVEIWHRHVYHIPRVYDFFFLEEMVFLGFLKKEHQHQQRYLFFGSKIEKVMERLTEGVHETKEILESPLLYLYVFSRMLEVFGHKNQMVNGRQLINVWRIFIPNVPRIFDSSVLTEMCNYGFIRRINSQKYIFYGGRGTTKLRKLNMLNLW